MAKFQFTDQNTGKKYVMTAPDQASAIAAFQKFSGGATQQQAPAASGPNLEGLAIPGTAPTQGYYNQVPPSLRFGFTSADTLNPLPAIAAAGDGMAGQFPILGPRLQNWRDEANAGIYGGTPAEARADINRTVAKNPEANVAGKVAGTTLPYLAAAEVPLLNSALGFTGPWFQRLGATVASQYAINTGDNLARGQDINEAAKNGAIASVMSAPFAALGKGPKPTGAQADAVEVMKREGIPLSGGQARGSKPLMTMESQLGGAGVASFQEKQLGALTAAALKRAGINAKDASPPVLQAAYAKLGRIFETLAGMTSVKVDKTLQDDVLKAATDYEALVGQPASIVEQFMNRVGSLAQQNGGVLKGDNYKVLITDLRKAGEASSSNEVRTALKEIRTALDDAVERSMGGKTREAWQTARQQYKNLIHVTDAVSGAGAMAARGLMTPASLRQAISVGDKRNYAKGFGDLNELSRAANITIVPIPDSGTAGRLSSIAGMSAIPAGTAALATGNLGQAAAVFGGLAAPALAGRAMLSAPGRSLLGKGGSTIPAAAARGLIPSALPSLPFLGG